jgi:hypothetical protein
MLYNGDNERWRMVMPRPSLISQGKQRKYEVQHLYDKHHQVLRLTALGTMKPKDIARIVNLSPQMVSNIVNSTIGQDILKVIRGSLDKQLIDISQAIKELAPRAVETISELLESEDARVRLKAATDILDRSGYAAPKNLNISHTHRVSQEDIEEIKRRCMESGLLSTVEIPDAEVQALADGDVVDAEFDDEAEVKEKEVENGSNNVLL